MKKTLYIIATTVLGLLLSLILHAAIEMIALQVIFTQPERYLGTIWWDEWNSLHRIFSTMLSLIGLIVGIYTGLKWWEPYGSKPSFFHWRKLLH
jgi:hypothetical protein